METSTSYKIAVFALLATLFFLNHSHQQLKSELADYQSALGEANDNIDDANSMIEDAQGYAWSDYEEMGYALDNLSTVDNVDTPY